MNLTDAVCVVTGGTEGIGHATALALAERGAAIAICARSPERVDAVAAALRDRGYRVEGIVCDVADEESVQRMAAQVAAALGPADVLVNNAGLAHFATVDRMSVAQFDETMAVNVRGLFLVTRAFLPEMQRRRRGHIVNIASLAGRNAVAGGAAYAASKHAVLGFSKSLLLEVRQYGIRVTAICPGTVVTPFFEKSGAAIENPDRKLQADDVARTVVAAVDLPDRALLSEIDLRPANP